MSRVAIAYSTKDRVELTEKTIAPLLQDRGELFDLYWFDASRTEDGKKFFKDTETDVKIPLAGGVDYYICYALTHLLHKGYDYVGLVENDVLLDVNWFEPTFALFDKYRSVGAVSARCYKDRILIQKDDHAIMHNLGAGMVLLSRDAVWTILRAFRTGFSSENRRMFALLSGIDIGGYWAFRGSDHMLVADWQWDRVLASNGMLSLALTPAKARQLEDIAAQGLEMATEPVEQLRNDKALEIYIDRLEKVKYADWLLPTSLLVHEGVHTFFAHQLPLLGAEYDGDWRYRHSQGFGPHSWQAGAQGASVSFCMQGSCEVLVSGGVNGARLKVIDETGFKAEPELKPEGPEGAVLALVLPAAVTYRRIRLEAEPGVGLFAVKTHTPQPVLRHWQFDWHALPPL